MNWTILFFIIAGLITGLGLGLFIFNVCYAFIVKKQEDKAIREISILLDWFESLDKGEHHNV